MISNMDPATLQKLIQLAFKCESPSVAAEGLRLYSCEMAERADEQLETRLMRRTPSSGEYAESPRDIVK